jgi:hypothetical protein
MNFPGFPEQPFCYNIYPLVCLPTRLLCTSEDECKWFFYHQMIYSPETDNQGKTLVTFTFTIYMKQGLLFHNVTYSVHDEFLMSHGACLVALPVPPWTSCLLHCCRSIAYLAPHWVGLVPPSAPLPMVTPFPSGSTHSLISLSATLRIPFPSTFNFLP